MLISDYIYTQENNLLMYEKTSEIIMLLEAIKACLLNGLYWLELSAYLNMAYQNWENLSI
jgi:hypothetical protein